MQDVALTRMMDQTKSCRVDAQNGMLMGLSLDCSKERNLRLKKRYIVDKVINIISNIKKLSDDLQMIG